MNGVRRWRECDDRSRKDPTEAPWTPTCHAPQCGVDKPNKRVKRCDGRQHADPHVTRETGPFGADVVNEVGDKYFSDVGNEQFSEKRSICQRESSAEMARGAECGCNPPDDEYVARLCDAAPCRHQKPETATERQ